MLRQGDYLKVKTKTQNDVFGTVVYKIEEVGLPAPEPERKAAGKTDGVRCRMLGGSGPSARAGLVLTDSEEVIQRGIKSGIVEVIPAEMAKKLERFYDKPAKESQRRIGVMDW
jgi:hypothetical protein